MIKDLLTEYENAILEKDQVLQLKKLKEIRNKVLLFISSENIKPSEIKEGINLLTRIAFSIN